MFLGYGGSHFKDGSAEPNVNSEAGINALNMMKKSSDYMNPDFLTRLECQRNIVPETWLF